MDKSSPPTKHLTPTRRVILLILTNIILLCLFSGGVAAEGWVLQNQPWAAICSPGNYPLNRWFNCNDPDGATGSAMTLSKNTGYFSYPPVVNGYPLNADKYKIIFNAKNLDSANPSCFMRYNIVAEYFHDPLTPALPNHHEEFPLLIDETWSSHEFIIDSGGIGFNKIQLSLAASDMSTDGCDVISIDEIEIYAWILDPTPTPTATLPTPTETATGIPTVCGYLPTPAPAATVCSNGDPEELTGWMGSQPFFNAAPYTIIALDQPITWQAGMLAHTVGIGGTCNPQSWLYGAGGWFSGGVQPGDVITSIQLYCATSSSGGDTATRFYVSYTGAPYCNTPAIPTAELVCTTPQYQPTGTPTATASSTPLTATMTVQAQQTSESGNATSQSQTATAQAGPTEIVGTPCPACDIQKTITAQAQQTGTAQGTVAASATNAKATADKNATLTATAVNGTSEKATADANATATAEGQDAQATAAAGTATAQATVHVPPKACDYERYIWFCDSTGECKYVTKTNFNDPVCNLDFGFATGACPVGYVPSDAMCWLNTPTPMVTAVPTAVIIPVDRPANGADCCAPVEAYVGKVLFGGWLNFDWLIWILCLIYTAILTVSERVGCLPQYMWNQIVYNLNYISMIDQWMAEYFKRVFYNWHETAGPLWYAFAGMAEILLIIGGKIAAAKYVTETALATSLTSSRIFFQVGWVQAEIIYNGLMIQMGNSWTYIPFGPLQAALKAFRIMTFIWEFIQSTPEWNAYNFNMDLHNLTQPVINMATDLRMAIYLMFQGIYTGLSSGWVSISNAFYNALAWALSFMPRTISIIDISTAIRNISKDLIYSLWLLASVMRVRIDDAISWLNNFMNWQLPYINAIVQWLYAFDIRNFIADLADSLIDNLLYATSEMLARFREIFRLTSLIVRVAIAQIASFTRWLSWWQTTPMVWLSNLTNPLPSEALFLRLAEIIPQYIDRLLNLMISISNLMWFWFNYPYFIMIAFWSGIEAGFNVTGYTIIPVCTAHPDPWCAFYYGIWTLNAVASQTFLLPFFLVGMLVVTLYVLQKNVEELWNAL